MRWDVLATDSEKLALAQALVPISAKRGWGATTLGSAAESAFGDAEAWRRCFPRGAIDAIWFISEASDESMAAAFESRPASRVADVISERLQQNSELKPFVFRVMVFDVLHPFQAIARMQRTAQVMRHCLAPGAKVPGTTLLNWTYTFIVFVWLCDRTRGDALTMRLNQWLMRCIGG
ncbi:MAG: hypothetical protein NT015_11450 [Alphaproteobacteria bacterium]|nr:hypothetical protein [Alphaproteobacteria bacterium]